MCLKMFIFSKMKDLGHFRKVILLKSIFMVVHLIYFSKIKYLEILEMSEMNERNKN